MEVAKYHQRPVRYVLQPQDDQFLRLGQGSAIAWEENTTLQDISLTGLSFTTPADLHPELGERIKVQFVIPGGHQVACLAIVSRIQHDKKNKASQKVIGIQFHDMDTALRVYLTKTLANKVRLQQQIEKKERTQTGLYLRFNSFYLKIIRTKKVWLPLLGLAFCAGLAFLLLR